MAIQGIRRIRRQATVTVDIVPAGRRTIADRHDDPGGTYSVQTPPVDRTKIRRRHFYTQPDDVFASETDLLVSTCRSRADKMSLDGHLDARILYPAF